jgi:hypothetical protein
MRRLLQRLLVLTLAGITLPALGCNFGGGRSATEGTLEGTVKYGNEPVLVALVIAAGPNGSAEGFIGEDGRYKIEKVPVGEVTLAVNVAAGKAQLGARQMSGQKVPKVVEMPAKYGDPATSGIKTTISKGVNTYDIVIPK